MLVSVSAPASASGAADYYVKGSAKNPIDGKYYLSQNGLSFWGGGAKEALGLPNGPVQEADFINMLSGKLPNGQQLGRMVKGKLERDIGRDLTISASKSASLLAIGPGGEKIMDAFIRANTKGMAFLEKELAHTRIYDKDTGKQIVTGGQKIVHATFIETLNRAGEPQIHAHNIWPNIALGKDNRFRSALMGAVYTHKILLGAVVRGYFGDELKKMGLSLEPAGKHGLFEIKGIPRETIEAFSTRRADILAAAKGGPKDSRTLSRLVLKTRPKKTTTLASDIIARQKAVFDKLGQSAQALWDKALGMPSPEKVMPSDALSNAVMNLSETQRDFARLDILKAGLISVYGNVTVDALQAEIDKQVEAGKLLQSTDGRSYTTPRIIRQEKQVITEMKKGHLQGGVISHARFRAIEKGLEGLTQGQSDAVKLILTDKSRTNGVQGFAGTGKTTLLRAAIPHAKTAGLTVIGIAPTDTAVSGLEEAGVFDKVMTSQKFAMSPVGNSSTLLVVDEASMLGTEDMLSILRFANSKNLPKLVLMGDIKQLPAVTRGTPFKDLQEAGLRTAHVNEIIRQNDPRHRQGVQELAIGKIKEAIKTLDKEVHEVTRQDMTRYAVQAWHGLKDHKAPIAVQTHKQKREINAAIKGSLLRQQYKPPPGTEIKVWHPVRLEAADRTRMRAYEDVTHIRFNRPLKGLKAKRGEIYKIIGRDQHRSSLTLQNGKTRITFSPAKHASGKSMIETYSLDTMTLHAGDRIRFTRGQRGHIDNNDLAQIKRITEKDITFEMDKGKTVTLSREGKAIRHIDHGWAATAYALQGKTVTNAMTIMPSHSSHLTTLESLYVGASRHRGRLTIITDDSERLIKTLEADLEAKLEKVTFNTDKEAPKTSAKQMQLINAQAHLKSNEQNHQPESSWQNIRDEKERKLEVEIPQPERQRQDRSR